MQPLQTHADIHGVQGVRVLKVVRACDLADSEIDSGCCLLWSPDGKQDSSAGLAGIFSPCALKAPADHCGIVVQSPKDPSVVSPGDVIRIVEGHSLISVLFRRGSPNNTLLVTERCNSNCIMCSQPPKDVDNRPYVENALEAIPLIDRSVEQLGISGGEPTLLGDDLLLIINSARHHLPETGLHILSNGRRFSDPEFTRIMCAAKHPNLLWGIPLYSDIPDIHDYIVQSHGAWRETLTGLNNLGWHGSNVELRVVIQKRNAGRLGELAYMLFRNLSFVKHVAFMGIEPMGFAKANYEAIWIDPGDFADDLTGAVYFLANRGINVSVYNLPLCVLPEQLRPFAARSISDWKNVHLPECNICDVRASCSGFFSSIAKDWIGRDFGPIESTTHLSQGGLL